MGLARVLIIFFAFYSLELWPSVAVFRSDGPDNKIQYWQCFFCKRLVPEAIVSPAGGGSLSGFGAGRIQE
jgi:hypothetical protein